MEWAAITVEALQHELRPPIYIPRILWRQSEEECNARSRLRDPLVVTDTLRARR
jgi:hypothetical protein